MPDPSNTGSSIEEVNAEIDKLLFKLSQLGIPDAARVIGMNPIQTLSSLHALIQIFMDKGIFTEEEFLLARQKEIRKMLESALSELRKARLIIPSAPIN